MKIELSPEARSLVEAGRAADAPSPEQRARLDRRIGAALGLASLAGASLAAKSAAAATGSSHAGLLGKAAGALSQLSASVKLASAVVVVGAGVGLGATSWSSAPAPAPGAPVAAKERAASPALAPSEQLGAAQPVVEAEPAARELAVEPVEAAPAPRAAARNRAARASTPSLQKELALLGAAQYHLREGEAARALKLLERHTKRFPKGTLRQERNAARAIALCMLGRSEDGRRIARELARNAPESPLAARVGAACSSASPASP